MVVIEKNSSTERICNSCVDKDRVTHEISIGDGNVNTTINLCKRCLHSLYQQAGEINVSVSEIL